MRIYVVRALIPTSYWAALLTTLEESHQTLLLEYRLCHGQHLERVIRDRQGDSSLHVKDVLIACVVPDLSNGARVQEIR